MDLGLPPASHAPAQDAAITPLPGSDFYYASLYLEPAPRHAVQVIEACRRAITGIPQTCSDRGVAHLKLAWWYEELGRLDTAEATRHPLVQALAPLAVGTPALKTWLLRLVEKVDAGLQEPVLPTRAAVIAAIQDLHGEILQHFVHIGGSEAAQDEATLLGLACRVELAYELRGLRQHRRRGPLYLAADHLAAHGRSVESVRQAASSTELGTLVQEELDLLATELHDAIGCLPRAVRRRQRLLCTLAGVAEHALKLTLADGCQVLERRIELLPIHKLWIAWRTRRFG